MRNRLLGFAFLLAALPAFAQWGGELRLSLRSEPRTFHPAMVDEDAGEMVRYLTGGVLVRVNRVTQEPEPSLAAGWKILDGGRAIRFQLREGVLFSDGTPFTADDVVYTMEVLMDQNLHSPVGDSFRMEGGPVRAYPDGADGVILRFPAPLAGGVRLFDQVCLMSRRSKLKEMAVLGPFYVKEHKPGVYLRLERNPHYWKRRSGRRLPYLDSVRLDIEQSREIEFLRFQRGELHMISSLDPDQFQELSRTRASSARDAGASLDNQFLWFNMAPSAPLAGYEKKWFASRCFRLAISHAIRRDDLCRVVYHGRAAPGVGPFSPANLFWFNRGLKPPGFDAGSRRLLAEDGFRADGGGLRDREGHPVEFSMMTNSGNTARERMAAMIQQDLAALGIRLNIVTLDFASLIERIGTCKVRGLPLGPEQRRDRSQRTNELLVQFLDQSRWNPSQPRLRRPGRPKSTG